MAAKLQMTDGEYRLFARLVRSHCGLHFGPETRLLLENRVSRRMREIAVSSYAAYHHEISDDARRDGELAHLIDELTTNETYFFRERGQLNALVREIVPEALAQRGEQGGGPVRIWSAGCSSGEEPYSIVMLAMQAGIDVGRELRVYGSDVSRRMIQRARAGRYREGSFRETEDALRERYFAEKDGEWLLADAVRRSVDFIHLNLMEAPKVALLGAMDVILCRNVIIYFDREGKGEVIGTLEEKLRPGGHLLLGHSESLINLTTSLELRSLSQDLVYRRPAPGLALADPWHRAAREAIFEVEESS